MQRRVQLFFDSMVRAYHVSDYDYVTRCFETPGAIYISDAVIVLSSRQKVNWFLKDQCRRNYELGVRSVSCRVHQKVTLPRRHFWAEVTWNHHDCKGRVIYAFNARYFCRDRGNYTPVVQLVEVPDVPDCYTAYEVNNLDSVRRLHS